jgi:hypothetical protein
VQGDALTWRHVDEDERDARTMSVALELSRMVELLEPDRDGVVGHGRSLFRASVYGFGYATPQTPSRHSTHGEAEEQ